MLPIRDNLRPRNWPLVTWGLIAINVLVFVHQLRLSDQSLGLLYRLWGVVPARLTAPDWARFVGYPDPGYETFITSLFLHGGWLHIIGNLWTLWLFGDDVEDRMGSGRFVLFYMLSGIIAGLGQVVLYPDTFVPTIGASGAIAGVMGAYLLLFPHARIEILIWLIIYIDIWSIPAALYLPLWFLAQLYEGTLALATSAFTSVAVWAHIAGFLAGVVTVTWFLPPADPAWNPYRYKTTKRRPQRVVKGQGFIMFDK